MSFKKIKKILIRGIARNSMMFFYWLFSFMPFYIVKSMMRVMIAIAFKLVIRHRKIAQESLNIAFGEKKTQEEINEIIKKCFSNFGKSMIEMVYCMSHPDQLTKTVVFEGIEHLEKALSKGKGVVVVTAHFGNFPLMMISCIKKGYKTNCILRPTRDRKLENFLIGKRAQAGLNAIYTIPRTRCVKLSLKALKNNELLFIPIDQNFGNGKGVFVDFFGQKAATATGPVVFATRTGAAILPMFIIRLEDDSFKIFIEPELKIEKKDSEQETLVFNISKITKIIEKYIRKYPHEWGWMHRRWKTRPKGK